MMGFTLSLDTHDDDDSSLDNDDDISSEDERDSCKQTISVSLTFPPPANGVILFLFWELKELSSPCKESVRLLKAILMMLTENLA